MPSTKEYLGYVLDCLSDIEGITYRPMMGEYLIYYNGKYVGGVCDDRFLVKCFKSVDILMPPAPRELPYEGGKEMLLVENTEDREFLARLMDTLYNELPQPKSAKSKPKK